MGLVTGSGRNIGRATVLELASRGADVVVNARANGQEAESVAGEARSLGVKALAFVADVSVQDQVNRMVDDTLTEFGRIDILVNNAGLRRESSITQMSVEEWREVLGVNLDGPFYCSQAVVPAMISAGGGRIINVSGLNAFSGRADWAHVCASKMGALGLTRALALELAPARNPGEPHRPGRLRHNPHRRTERRPHGSTRVRHSLGPPGYARGGGADLRLPGVGRSQLYNGSDHPRQWRGARLLADRL